MTQQALELGEPGGIAVIGRDSRRFNCLVLLWMTALTIGLITDLSLHFALRPPPEGPRPATAAHHSEGVMGSSKSTQHPPLKEVTSSSKPTLWFDLISEASNATGQGPILWKNSDDQIESDAPIFESVKIVSDGNYFLYGQVTLSSGVSSHTLKVIKKCHGILKGILLERSFDERSNSTGFFGKILPLRAGCSIHINCPNPGLIRSGIKRDLLTFLGIYKLDN